MKTNYEPNRVLWGVFLLLGLLIISNPATGQVVCPSPSTIPPTAAWTDVAVPLTIAISPTCTLLVSYCWRIVPTNHYQTYVKSIQTVGPGCGGINVFAYMVNINLGLLKTYPGDPINCNENPLHRMTHVTSSCWKNLVGGGYIPCGEGSCLESYEICYINGVWVRQGATSYTTSGTVNCNTSEGCTEVTCGS